MKRRKQIAVWLTVLAILAVIPYVRSLSLPFISDDYVHIAVGRDWGGPSGWGDLLGDALYRCRTTSVLAANWLYGAFGMNLAVFRWSSLLLHVLNTWLVLALGLWRPVGWRVAAPAAAFFALHEGHQEAVIWHAAMPELLVFLFLVLSFLAWVMWLQTPGNRWRWYAASFAMFVLALASKESGVAAVPLLFVAALAEGKGWKRSAAAVTPFALIAALYAWSIHAARDNHLFYRDGTFSLDAPFLATLANSTAALLWVWGGLGLAVLALRPVREWGRLAALAFAWIWITLLPYSFLTYMPRLPSRHVYVASAGLSLLVGAGFLTLWERTRTRWRWAPAAVALIAVVYNAGWVWTRKQRQFAGRTVPTEELVRFARGVNGPLYVHSCFPYALDVAASAIELRLGKRLRVIELAAGAPWPRGAAVFCLGKGKGHEPGPGGAR